MSSSNALLDKGKVLAFMTVFCLVEAVWSWVDVSKHVRQHVDLITGIFSLILMAIAANIAYKSSYRTDQQVFAAIAVAFALNAAGAVPLPPAAMSASNVACAFMWTAAAFGCLIAVGTKSSHEHLC